MIKSAQEEKTLWDFLDEKNFPWRESRKNLIQKYGIKKSPWYNWNTVILGKETEICSHMPQPMEFSIRGEYNNDMPPLLFSGIIHKDNDCEKNIEFAISQLKPIFGKPASAERTAIGRYLQFQCKWRFGKAGIILTASLPVFNEFAPPDPEDNADCTRYGCHIKLDTGFRLETSAQEMEALKNFHSFDTPLESKIILRGGITENPLEIARNIPNDLKLKSGFGMDDKDNYLIILDNVDAFLIPFSSITRLFLTQATGTHTSYSKIHVYYKIDGENEINFEALSSPYTHGLDEFAGELAKKLSKKLEIQGVDNQL